jgi:hypothetical protein
MYTIIHTHSYTHTHTHIQGQDDDDIEEEKVDRVHVYYNMNSFGDAFHGSVFDGRVCLTRTHVDPLTDREHVQKEKHSAALDYRRCHAFMHTHEG